MNPTTFDLRRENLRRLILDKFDGNRAAFSRTAGVHQNQINLVLSPNPLHQRNLGEALARRMEEALKLSPGYLDAEIAHGADESFTVKAWAVPSELKHIVRKDDILSSVSLHATYISQLEGKITSPVNLATCRISTHDMSPEITFDEHVVIDTGVKTVTVDGVYILGRGTDMFLRRVTKQITGEWLIQTANAAQAPTRIDTLKGIKAAGRVVMVWRHNIL